jgi:hypothetical protein
MKQGPRGREYWLWLVLALGIARLWLMPLPSSFWVDEMATAFVVEHGADHPSFAVAPQVPDSLYFWLPRTSVRLLGRSEIAYRLPGMLAMGIALWLAGSLAARLIHPQARWFAVFACLALHGFNYYALDARPYGLAITVSVAAMWFLARWLDDARWADGLAFALLAAVLWRVHLLDWPMYLVFAWYAALRAREKTGWIRTAALFAPIGIALTPVAWHAAALSREASAHVIVPVPDLREFIHMARWNLVAICAAGAFLFRRRGKPEPPGVVSWLTIGAWWLAPPVCLFVFSHLTGESVFVARYVSIALPGAALAATLATAFFLPPRYWKPAAAVVGLGAVAALGQWQTFWPAHEHSGWRQAAAYANSLAGPETPVICPSPFIEARPPAWSPDYPLPGFLYAHLAYYPIQGRILPFPHEGLAAAMPMSGDVLIYGGRGNVSAIARWYTDGGRMAERRDFGDVSVVRIR